MLNASRPSARLVGAGLVATMVLGSALGAEAATKKKKHKPVKVTRTVTLKYTGGCVAEVWPDPKDGGGGAAVCPAGSADFEQKARPSEKYVSVTVADASGRAVPGGFWEPGDKVGGASETQFCGRMKDYRIPSNGSVHVDVDGVGAVAYCPGVATQGTVTLVYSNLP